MRGKRETRRDLKPNEVEIQFTDIGYAQSFGCRPLIVHRDTALQYVKKNVAKITRDSPAPNIVPPIEPPKEIVPEKTGKIVGVEIPSLVSSVALNPYSIGVVWIGSNSTLRKVKKIGVDCGFIICEMTPLRLHVASAMVSDVVLISSSLLDYDEHQRSSINILLHQKRVPYILIAEDFDEAMDTKRLINCIINAKSILFMEKEIMNKWLDHFSEIINDWIVFDEPFRFWKEIGVRFGGKNG